MDNHIKKLSPKQLRLVTLNAVLENTALLRLMIANQVKIMEKLGIQSDLASEDVYNDLMPGESHNEKSITSLTFKAAEPLAGLLFNRAWEWAHMNDAAVQRLEEDNEDNT